MRILRGFLLTVVAVALIVVGVANMDPVTLRLLPADLDPEGAWTVEDLPLAAVILAAGVVGVLVGQLLEWVREARHRRLAAQRKREVGRLRAEINRLSARLEDTDDDLPDLVQR